MPFINLRKDSEMKIILSGQEISRSPFPEKTLVGPLNNKIKLAII
jgi:hypothetical protein